MADPTPAALQIFFTGLINQFYEGYAGTPQWSDQVAMSVPSDTELETYGWMDRLPTMREWLGPRVVTEPVLQNRSLTNKHWETTVSISRDKFVDDKFGLFAPMVREQARQAAKQHDYQLASLLESNPVCFDGLSFFNTAHLQDTTSQLSAATYSNDLTTTALNPTNWGLAKSTMRGFLGRDGKPFGVYPTLLVVPPALEEPAMLLKNADIIATQTFANYATNVGSFSNIYKGSFEVLVIPELTHSKIWYTFYTAGPIKALLKQLREPINMVPLINPTDPNVFWQKEYVLGGDMRSAYDVTLPWLAVRFGAGL